MKGGVTWGDLFAIVAMLVGLLTFVVGLLEWFAGGMSDNPTAGEEAGKSGCIIMSVGLAFIAIAVWVLRH